MDKKNILVFPCGSEVALEIHRSLRYSIHFNLIGASSVDDHGKFVFENYIDGVPFIDEPEFIPAMTKLIREYKIDAIYPAMDYVITLLKRHEKKMGCRVISSDVETTEICLSKSKTYSALNRVIATTRVYGSVEEIESYPVFVKPDIGYGARGTKKCSTPDEVKQHLSIYPDSLVLEYLPGKEYTVDCFSDYKGRLHFSGARQRKRISNGISVNTSTMPLQERFQQMAEKINSILFFSGAWFFQVKEDKAGKLVLMEVASRLGGSSGVYRMKGINFALLSAFNAFEIPVSVMPNDYEVEMDRALDCLFHSDIYFDSLYIDLDSVFTSNSTLSHHIVSSLYSCINSKKRIILVSRMADIKEVITKYRLESIFDEIIIISECSNSQLKDLIQNNAVWITSDEYQKEVYKKEWHIPILTLDMLTLITDK